MKQIIEPLFLVCETPLHAGSGSDLGDIDLPIQREIHTGFPKVEASSLKGALRMAFENGNADFVTIQKVFGYDDANLPKAKKDLLESTFNEKKDFAGAINITDARILLFPVKSLKGIFAWVTCPRVLQKFAHELKDIAEVNFTYSIPQVGEDEPVKVSNLDFLKIDTGKIQLEQYEFQAEVDPTTKEIASWFKGNIFNKIPFDYWQNQIEKALVIVSDDDFADFVKFSTEIITRTKINNETGTVEDGALFTEEFLPSETVMYSLVVFINEFSADKNRMSAQNVKSFFMDINNKPNHFQLGGNATLGKGIVNLIVPEFHKNNGGSKDE
jgi:CRISPR-associated protein Cmr4